MGTKTASSFRPILNTKNYGHIPSNVLKANKALFSIQKIQLNQQQKRGSNSKKLNYCRSIKLSEQNDFLNQRIKQAAPNNSQSVKINLKDNSEFKEAKFASFGNASNKYSLTSQPSRYGFARNSQIKMIASNIFPKRLNSNQRTSTIRNVGSFGQVPFKMGPTTDRNTKTDEYFKDFEQQQMNLDYDVQKPIKLSKEEDKILGFMKDALRHNNLDKSVHMKVAGDWVRDKCMGQEATTNMSFIFQSDDYGSAQDLAKMFENFKKDAYENIYFDGDRTPSNIVLRGYQHRSLPVAFVKIFDQEIDICKIPIKANSEIDLLDDAKDRDFTINSLYYSIDFDTEKMQVIDPLGTGLKHLKEGVISLCQDNSLYDDPLRLFRAIEISSKYDFEISKVIRDQILDYSTMLWNLDSKVGSQRLATQLLKMFSDRDQGIKNLKIMSELNVVRNYITRLHELDQHYGEVEYIPDTDAYELAKTILQAIKPSNYVEDHSRLFKKVFFLCMMKDLEYNLFDLEIRIRDLALPYYIYDFVLNNLERYPKVMKFDLHYYSSSYLHRMKQQDTDEFLPILCGVEKHAQELYENPGLDVNSYIEEYRKYLAMPYYAVLANDLNQNEAREDAQDERYLIDEYSEFDPFSDENDPDNYYNIQQDQYDQVEERRLDYLDDQNHHIY